VVVVETGGVPTESKNELSLNWGTKVPHAPSYLRPFGAWDGARAIERTTTQGERMLPRWEYSQEISYKTPAFGRFS